MKLIIISNILFLDLSITNFTIYLLLTVSFIIGFYKTALIQNTLIPNNLQIIAETIYNFILSLIIEQTGAKGLRFFPVLFTLFNFILFIYI